jgi:ATP-dependent Clp protease ATP-binding subunit ClpC
VFDRATPRARIAVGDAAPIARGWGHDQIATEHLLLALYRDPDSIAGKILAESGLPEDQVAAAVEERSGRGPGAPDGDLPFSPAARAVFSGALAAAADLGHNYIGTEHLLIGLARADGLAGEMLNGAGLTPEALGRSVTEKLSRLQ